MLREAGGTRDLVPIPGSEEDVRSSVRFGRGLNPLVVKELKQLHHQEGEPREEA